MRQVHWEDPEESGRDGGGWGGSGWGPHVIPWLILVNVWQKPLQYCKVISLQLIKIIGRGRSLTIFFFKGEEEKVKQK